MNLYTLPEWKDHYFPEEDDGDKWKYAAGIEAAKDLYNKWREVFNLVMIFSDTLPEDGPASFTKELILENALIVSPKLISVAGDSLFILQMENASIIRTNCKQLMDRVIFAGLTDSTEKHHEQVIRNAMEEFKILFREWVATFKKDDFEDEWGLF